ncbi:sensor histidine kinase [Rhizomonospora bruguierae]|uniref:sensor histidine kinase n=1 Tax=Rhizomonospora bruguierae TaxID=1581705 RepID=UPI0020BF2FF1|nr:ATP-binding protein [Micromonospora sp. NBRC 107566]
MAQVERERPCPRPERPRRLESLSQLAGAVAHDYNNLLAVILNYTAFVAEEIADAEREDPDRWLPVARDVAQIERAAHRAIALTHRLLAFGRQEVVHPEVLDLNRVVAGVRALLTRAIGERVRLTTAPAEGLWLVKADPGQLEQVLVNLAVNARDAMPSGGTLTISTGNRVAGDADPVPPGRYVLLRVSDTGVGMRPEVVSRAFEPFYTTKPRGEGTGLGLATVHGIVAQAGGHTRIASMPGQGSTVSVLIPAADEEPEPGAEAPEPGADA